MDCACIEIIVLVTETRTCFQFARLLVDTVNSHILQGKEYGGKGKKPRPLQVSGVEEERGFEESSPRCEERDCI